MNLQQLYERVNDDSFKEMVMCTSFEEKDFRKVFRIRLSFFEDENYKFRLNRNFPIESYFITHDPLVYHFVVKTSFYDYIIIQKLDKDARKDFFDFGEGECFQCGFVGRIILSITEEGNSYFILKHGDLDEQQLFPIEYREDGTIMTPYLSTKSAI